MWRRREYGSLVSAKGGVGVGNCISSESQDGKVGATLGDFIGPGANV